MSILIPDFFSYIHIVPSEKNSKPLYMSNYKTIEGKKLSVSLLDQAEKMVEGAGDGRISLKDAEILFGLVKEDNILTNVERDTIEYIQKNYKWTPAADEWFRREMMHWQAHKPPMPITLDELSKKHFAKHEVLTDPYRLEERKHLLSSAAVESADNHEDIGLWVQLDDGTTVEVQSNFFELEGDFVQLRGGTLVPIRAIERIEL
jgi:hypothetical protein